jgi:uncharacterized protein YwqG
MMKDQGLVTMLTAKGLGGNAAGIVALARSAIRIETARCEQTDVGLGASRFGGVPDVPRDFVWPSYDGRPLSFIAQFDLDQVPHPDDGELPQRGSLAFFYEVESMKWGFDPKDRGCAHVAWFDAEPAALVRTAPPVTGSPAQLFHPSALSFACGVDLPDAYDLIFERILDAMTDEQQSTYAELLDARNPTTYHHLLGHPQLVQNDMRLECELASNGINVGTPEGYEDSESARLRAHDWRLLLQVDTDEEGPGWMWGDVGRIYFWIKQHDLAARRFDKSWLVLQCC